MTFMHIQVAHEVTTEIGKKGLYMGALLKYLLFNLWLQSTILLVCLRAVKIRGLHVDFHALLIYLYSGIIAVEENDKP